MRKTSLITALILLAIGITTITSPLAANPFTAPQAGSPEASVLPAARPVRAGAADPSTVAVQASLHRRLGSLMAAWKDSAGPNAAWGIVGAAFLYGILHAFGPGHRKTVVFSLYLTKSAPVWEPAGTGFALALSYNFV